MWLKPECYETSLRRYDYFHFLSTFMLTLHHISSVNLQVKYYHYTFIENNFFIHFYTDITPYISKRWLAVLPGEFTASLEGSCLLEERAATVEELVVLVWAGVRVDAPEVAHMGILVFLHGLNVLSLGNVQLFSVGHSKQDFANARQTDGQTDRPRDEPCMP